MVPSDVLDKANQLKPAEDYNFLRRQGIKHIEKLAGNVWTDFNTHDPGITLLESLCYAITDLAYRTGYEIKDLITPEVFKNENWKNIFYTAKQILPCNPVTINDYRKLLIDMDGVRNAWITISRDYEVPLYIRYLNPQQFKDVSDYQNKHPEKKGNCLCESMIKLPANFKDHDEGEAKNEMDNYPGLDFSGSKIVELNGLYKIIIEYDESIIEKQEQEIVRKEVLKKLHNHRNVCEDFLSVASVSYRNFFLKTEVILNPDADPEMILAEMCYRIQNYFTPTLKFYTLEELMEKGKQVDEIFEGPLLEHGFIADDELENTDLFRDMRLSDIINSISEIDGMLAIKTFKINDEIKGSKDDDDPCGPELFFDEWIAGMKKEKLAGRLSIPSILKFLNPNFKTDFKGTPSEILFFKNNKKVNINSDRFEKLLRDLKSLDRATKLKGHTMDLPVPTGENRKVTDFYPVQYMLPFTYRVGEAGLPISDGKLRLTQSLQLKGYLAVFEQLFLNFVFKLGNISELFSFNDIKYKGKIKPKTDPCQKEEIIKSENITKANWLPENTSQPNYLVFKNEQSNCDERIIGYLCLFNECENYLSKIEEVIETEEEFFENRNNMLNHLMARFAEEMAEYDRMMNYMYPHDYLARITKNKTDLLDDYPVISSERSKAYNYKLEEEGVDFPGDEDEIKIAGNISGLEKRICRLLGFRDYQRNYIAPANIEIKEVSKKYFIIFLYDDFGDVLFESDQIQAKCKDEIMHCFMESGCCSVNFLRIPEFSDHSRRVPHKHASYSFDLKLNDGRRLTNKKTFETEKERETALQLAITTLHKICNTEGLHMVEHILLRPRGDNQVTDKKGKPLGDPYHLLDVCLDLCDMKHAHDERPAGPEFKFDIIVIPLKDCLDGKRWIVQLINVEKEGNIILLQEKFNTYEDASDFISIVRDYGSGLENYQVYKIPGQNKFYFAILDEYKNVKYESSCCFLKEGTNPITKKKGVAPEREKESKCMEGLNKEKDTAWNEVKEIKTYLAYELNLYCCENPCDHNEDPYSFRVTFVLPCWSKRFRDPDFRSFVEKTIHSETPAHIEAKIFWLDIDKMQEFEDVYFNWLIELARHEVPEVGLANRIVDSINHLKNCDKPCHEEEAVTPVLYNKETWSEKNVGTPVMKKKKMVEQLKKKK